MILRRSWQAYPPTYRAAQIKMISGWISSGASGSVVGLPGCGRSNLLGFLCNRPDVVQAHLRPAGRSVALIAVDLNNLPANSLSTFYRVILRAFQRVSDQFNPELQQKISRLYQKNEAERDPFLPQSALQDLLLSCQAEKIQIVLVFNRFDQFCQTATPRMVNTLRGLRDDFKDTLCYIAGMTREISYLSNPNALGSIYELLDQYVCWVGAMNEADSRHMIAEETQGAFTSLTEADLAAILNLTGGYPVLMKGVCHWWLTTEVKPNHNDWMAALLHEGTILYRLEKIWRGLTQEEQFVLSELQKALAINAKLSERFTKDQSQLLRQLSIKGICLQTDKGWRITIDLLAAYLAQIEGRGRGRIWLEEYSGDIYQGQTLLKDLTDLGRSLLTFLLKNARVRHTKTDLIINVWPDELRQEGVSDNSLYQVIFTLRQIIEVNPSQPTYLVNWRGKPEGGYQFFPEGRPG